VIQVRNLGECEQEGFGSAVNGMAVLTQEENEWFCVCSFEKFIALALSLVLL